MSFRILFSSVVAVAAVVFGGSASADTVLIFEPPGFAIDPDYGDRVTSTNQNGFIYGQAGPGFTPNVEVSYGVDLYHWDIGYGDLTNVLYTQAADLSLSLTLQADPGYDVLLHSFDLAGYGGDHPIDLVEVLNVANAAVYSQSNLLIEGFGDEPQHTSFVFGTPLRSSSLTLRIDTGDGGSYIGIDNIRFSQALSSTAVPEPGSLSLLAVAAAGALGLRLGRRGKRAASSQPHSSERPLGDQQAARSTLMP